MWVIRAVGYLACLAVTLGQESAPVNEILKGLVTTELGKGEMMIGVMRANWCC